MGALRGRSDAKWLFTCFGLHHQGSLFARIVHQLNQPQESVLVLVVGFDHVSVHGRTQRPASQSQLKVTGEKKRQDKPIQTRSTFSGMGRIPGSVGIRNSMTFII